MWDETWQQQGLYYVCTNRRILPHHPFKRTLYYGLNETQCAFIFQRPHIENRTVTSVEDSGLFSYPQAKVMLSRSAHRQRIWEVLGSNLVRGSSIMTEVLPWFSLVPPRYYIKMCHVRLPSLISAHHIIHNVCRGNSVVKEADPDDKFVLYMEVISLISNLPLWRYFRKLPLKSSSACWQQLCSLLVVVDGVSFTKKAF